MPCEPHGVVPVVFPRAGVGQQVDILEGAMLTTFPSLVLSIRQGQSPCSLPRKTPMAGFQKHSCAIHALMSDYGSLRKERSLSRLKDEGAQRRHPRMAVDPKCRPHACRADGSLVHRGLPVLVAAVAIILGLERPCFNSGGRPSLVHRFGPYRLEEGRFSVFVGTALRASAHNFFESN